MSAAQLSRALARSGEVSDTVLGEWVYCASHLAAHKSGWCTIPLDDKIGLGPDVDCQLTADEKCRKLGLKLYVDRNPK